MRISNCIGFWIYLYVLKDLTQKVYAALWRLLYTSYGVLTIATQNLNLCATSLHEHICRLHSTVAYRNKRKWTIVEVSTPCT